ncbi:MAG: 2-hydroxychromene-2-carboxylate isomerase [Pseudomonadota bacterium]|nr:2-hydroxychromene-2-carboxylate isomerase [Pseudomonadota bacterium]
MSDSSLRSLEYFYSVRSSFTYLGAARLNALAERRRLTIRHHPVDLGVLISVFDSIKEQQPADRPYAGARVYETSPIRENYTRSEYRRWSKRLGIPINVDPKNHYGARQLPSGAVILAQRRGLNVNALSHAILQALWRDDRDIADPAVIAALMDDLGFDVDRAEFTTTAMGKSVQDEFVENSREAAARGVFGSPSYIYNGELFFGQDRLDFLEEEVAGSR